MGRFIAAFALVVALLVGGGVVANNAYHAGLADAAAAAGSGTTVVVRDYAWAGPLSGIGFGFFGFIGALIFLFIVFGLLRAIFGAGRHSHGGRGWSGRDWSPEMREKFRGRWETGAHETFDDWHKRAHEGLSLTPPTS